MSIYNKLSQRNNELKPEDRTKAYRNYLISNRIQDGNYARKTAANSNTNKTRNCNANQNKYDIKSKECNAKPAM